MRTPRIRRRHGLKEPGFVHSSAATILGRRPSKMDANFPSKILSLYIGLINEYA